MHYAITNEENRVRKTFAYDTSTYELVYDGNINVMDQAWKWEHNIGYTGKEARPTYYDYLVTVESDKPINIFEKHVIAVAQSFYKNMHGDYFILTGCTLPQVALPDNEMMGTGGVTGWATDMMIAGAAASDQLGGLVLLNLLAFNTDETFFASLFGHYNRGIFHPTIPEQIGDEFYLFIQDMGTPLVFSLVNRFVGDFFALRAYGGGLSLFLSKYEDYTNARIKIYRKAISTMSLFDWEPEPQP